MLKKLLIPLTFAAALVFGASTASAGEATTVVKTNQAKLFKVIAKPKSAAQQKELADMFDKFLAYDEFAVRSLGKKWSTLDAAQQKKFKTLLTGLIRNNYKRNLKKLLAFNIRYEAEESKKGGTLVNSLATHKTDKREPPFELDFLMANVGGKMMIIDLITEQASMTDTYRAQFLRILKKQGFDKLIEKMQKKLDKQNAAG